MSLLDAAIDLDVSDASDEDLNASTVVDFPLPVGADSGPVGADLRVRPSSPSPGNPGEGRGEGSAPRTFDLPTLPDHATSDTEDSLARLLFPEFYAPVAPPPVPAPVAPAVTFIISTYNRRDVLLQTLTRLESIPTPHETHVVDNASPDGTAAAVRAQFPNVHLIARSDNRGSCAKNFAIHHARAPYIVFLDDDSYPDAASIERLLAHFEANPKLGAATFTVTLPDGSRECSAYPDVFIGCGVAFRREALYQVGGLPEDFFMQAEEYDLSLRLLHAGWTVRSFDDLHVAHLKTPGARQSERTTRLDVRNNLLLIARYFPEDWLLPYAWEWTRRYWSIASAKNHRRAFVRGLVEALVRIGSQSVDRREISPAAFEQFAKINETRRRLAIAKARHNLRRVLFVDYGKNLLAYRLAAESCGLEVVAIADPKLAGTHYHGIPVITDAQAATQHFDAAIISNLSPVHAQMRAAPWRTLTPRPVLDLFND